MKMNEAQQYSVKWKALKKKMNDLWLKNRELGTV